jgi:urease accessory protein
MICEKILGTLADFPGKTIDYVTIEWHEINKRLHKKTSRGGAEIAVRLGDEILGHGLRQDDVLGLEGDKVYAVDIPAFEVLVIRVDDPRLGEKVCWEIGNKHAPLFWGAAGEFITPYDLPIETLLRRLHGVGVERQTQKVDFSQAISGAAHGHEHDGHGHEQDGHGGH